MKNYLLLIFILLSCPLTGCASNCEKDILQSVKKSGEYMVLSSGHAFKVLGQDFIDPTQWQPNDEINVCSRVSDSSNSKLSTYQLTNVRRNESLVVLQVKEIPSAPRK